MAARNATAWYGTSRSPSSRFRFSRAMAAGSSPSRPPASIPCLRSTLRSDRRLRFYASLQDKYHVVPANCDYELADSLFKTGRAAMIINGDWSWSDYLNDPDIDAAVAPLPIVSATGQPMRPMVAPKGYSLNVNTHGATADAALEFVRHMTSDEVQRRIVERFANDARPQLDSQRSAICHRSNVAGVARPTRKRPADAGSHRVAGRLGRDAAELPGAVRRQHDCRTGGNPDAT